MAYTPRNFKGFGKIFLNKYDIGNTEQCNLGITTETTEVPNYMQVDGGMIYSNERVKDVEFSLTILDVNKKNLEIALRAATSTVTSSALSITETAVADQLIDFNGMATVTSVTIGGQPASEGTDYALTVGGLYPYTAGEYVITGTKIAHTKLQALVNPSIEYAVKVVLENEMVANTYKIIDIFKVILSPMSVYNFINSDQTKLELKGKALADTSKPNGESQYFTVLFN